MGKRREFTVEDVPLVGGALALDFLNTTGQRHSRRPRERLHAYADLVTWCRRAGVLDDDAAAALARHADRRPAAAAEALDKALRLREDLFAVLAPLAVGDPPPAEAVQQLDRWLAEACPLRTLELVGGRVARGWKAAPNRLHHPLWPILGSAEELLVSPGPLRRCGECDWLFLDETRNASRQWCKKQCADRVRARRYYSRRSDA